VAGARVAAVAGSTPQRSAEGRRQLGAERDFASADELIASDAVDVVHVCTPNHLHLPIALAALEAGKHVICEKPLALDLEGAEGLAAAAAATQLVTAVPFVYRYYPTVREARQRLGTPDPGALRLIHGGYLQDWLLDAEDYNWRVERGSGGASRAFADIGSHWCDLVEFVSGERLSALAARTAIARPRRIRSQTASFERGGGGEQVEVDTEDVATVLFETAGGALGSLVVSQVSAGRLNRLWFELSTESQTLVFDQERPEELQVLERASRREIPRDPRALSAEAGRYATLPGGHPQGYHDCFDAFVAEVYAAIAARRAPPEIPSFADGVRAARITEAVLDSARRREWVEVS
jgi:predicted dehydrogenase